MPRDAFSHVSTWVFDLDNTLYLPHHGLLERISSRMTGWIASTLSLSLPEADRLRHAYWARHGTTLAGLMAEHGVDPQAFLSHAHDLPVDDLSPCPDLRAGLGALPGRRIVFTNSTADWAHRVLAARGLDDLVDEVHGTETAEFHPKPMKAAFDLVFTRAGIAPRQAAFFEDDPRNLAEPAARGMRTVLVADTAPAPAPHIHHHTADLAGFLARLG